MFRQFLTLVCAVSVSGFAVAADKYKLDEENTSIKFVGTKTDGKHEGEFKKMKGWAELVSTDPETLKMELEIETASIESDDANLTKHLKSADFFDVKEHPKAIYKVMKVEKTEDGCKQIGELTLLGKTKKIEVPCKITCTDDGLTITSEFEIDRTEWGMSYGKGKIDDKVKLTVDLKAKK